MDFRLADVVKEIHGIDISSKMVATARQRAATGKIGNVSFAQATIFDEGFGRESFDVVLAFAIFHLLQDVRSHGQESHLSQLTARGEHR